jgi:hypothetical protein
MLDYYYIDLYFDPGRVSLRDVVHSTVSSLVSGGCSYEKVTVSDPKASGSVNFGEHVALAAPDLPAVASAYVDEMLKDGQRLISFPPLGRVMFSYPFRLDEDLLEDIYDEEEESSSSSEVIGLTFLYSAVSGSGPLIKASLSFWEEYILKNGRPEIQVKNMSDILSMIVRISSKCPPFFGAMNTEIRLNTDASLELLNQGRLPEGNEFIVVGGGLMPKLDMQALKASGYHMGTLPDGGVIIQMADKWAGLKAV